MLFIAADHRGLKRKNQLKQWLQDQRIPFKDLGAYVYEAGDDYPDFTKLVTDKILTSPQEHRGILLCGSGAGVDIAANKTVGIRSVLGFDAHQVQEAVEDDQVQILAIAADYTSKFKLFQLVKVFLKAHPKLDPKYLRRLEKINQLEKK